MGDETNKRTLLFIIFVVGAVASYGIFTFIQQSDRRVVVYSQLDEVEEMLQTAETIHTNCVTLSLSRENTPERVRGLCVNSSEFVSSARRFPADQAIRSVKQELLILADTMEEMTNTVSLHPNDLYGKELLDSIPDMISEVRKKASRARGKFWF